MITVICPQSLCRVQLFVTLQTIACQAPLSMGFPRQEYWRGLPFPSPEDLPDPGIEPASDTLTGGFFTAEAPGKPSCYITQLQNMIFWDSVEKDDRNITSNALPLDHRFLNGTEKDSGCSPFTLWSIAVYCQRILVLRPIMALVNIIYLCQKFHTHFLQSTQVFLKAKMG